MWLCSSQRRQTKKKHLVTDRSCRLAGYSSISILVNTCVAVANDAQCLFVCGFCFVAQSATFKGNLWMYCFRFKASGARWTVWVASANYNSNAVSLPVWLSCTQLHSGVVCVCVCVFACACECACARACHPAPGLPWPTSDAPIIHVHFAGRSRRLSWEECEFLRYVTTFCLK